MFIGELSMSCSFFVFRKKITLVLYPSFVKSRSVTNFLMHFCSRCLNCEYVVVFAVLRFLQIVDILILEFFLSSLSIFS